MLKLPGQYAWKLFYMVQRRIFLPAKGKALVIHLAQKNRLKHFVSSGKKHSF